MKENIKYSVIAFLYMEISIFLIATIPYIILLLTNSTSISLNEFIYEIFPLFYYNGYIFGITSWIIHVIIVLICIFAIIIPKSKKTCIASSKNQKHFTPS